MARNRRILITGCTAGIGYEATLELAKLPFDFILIGRDEAKLLRLKEKVLATSPAKPTVDYFVCDFESLDQVSKVSKMIGNAYRDLDIVINNAGIWEITHRKDSHGWEMTWVVNYLAPFVLTYNLFPLMKLTARDTRDVRIINVASNAHRFGQIAFPLAQKFQFFKLRGTYGSTKLANILNAFYLARLVKEDGISVNAVHPGVVATDLWRKLPKLVSTIAKKFMLTPKQGAEIIVKLASEQKLEATGQYYERTQGAKPKEVTRNEELQKQLFGETKKMVQEYLIG